MTFLGANLVFFLTNSRQDCCAEVFEKGKAMIEGYKLEKILKKRERKNEKKTKNSSGLGYKHHPIPFHRPQLDDSEELTS
jgi:hypothetical protein